MKNKLFKILLALAIIVLAGFLFTGNANKKQEIVSKNIVINKGENAKDIAFKLKTEKIVSNPYSFLVLAFLEKNWDKLQAGEYLLNSKMSNQEIVETLVQGKTIKETITIVEGWDSWDIARYLESKGLFSQEETIKSIQEFESNQFDFLSDKPKNLGLEGYIFPDTYFLEKNALLDDFLNKALTNFGQKLTPDLRDEIKKQNKSIFEIITMASLLEKEVISFEDKQIVSGILWKRLRAGIPLQVDATLLYAREKNKVSLEDTKIDSPYNTYQHLGLPLGPICNPGLESIKAAVYPKDSPYWYYLSKPNKETVFSKTLEEHNLAQAKYLK